MPQAKIDDNDKSTLIAYNDTTGLIEKVRVDPIFGGITMYAVNTGELAPTSLNNAKIDENDNATLLAWNDTTQKIEALRCDSSGFLLVTLAT